MWNKKLIECIYYPQKARKKTKAFWSEDKWSTHNLSPNKTHHKCLKIYEYGMCISIWRYSIVYNMLWRVTCVVWMSVSGSVWYDGFVCALFRYVDGVDIVDIVDSVDSVDIVDIARIAPGWWMDRSRGHLQCPWPLQRSSARHWLITPPVPCHGEPCTNII